MAERSKRKKPDTITVPRRTCDRALTILEKLSLDLASERLPREVRQP